MNEPINETETVLMKNLAKEIDKLLQKYTDQNILTHYQIIYSALVSLILGISISTPKPGKTFREAFHDLIDTVIDDVEKIKKMDKKNG
jgi:hypothetical protein